jgi:hypothetical protein
MEVTWAQPPPASPRRTTSQATLRSQSGSPGDKSEKSIFIPSASPLLLRRASCHDYTSKKENTQTFKRAGSLSSFKNRSNSVRKVAAHASAHASAQTSSDISILTGDSVAQVGRERVGNTERSKLRSETTRKSAEKSISKKNQLESPAPHSQADKSLFLNFDNIKEALFGDSKVLSPSKTGENLFPFRKPAASSNFERNGPEKEKTRKEILMHNPDKWQKAKTPVKDEFTEFSQYGSRFMPNKMEEKSKKTNLVDQFPGHKIVKKVAKTCQKHSQSRKSSTTDRTAEIPLRNDSAGNKLDKEQVRQGIEQEAPTALPRSKREKQNQHSLPLEKPKGEPEKFDPKYMEKKSAMLFKKAEQPQYISMNTDPRPQHYSLSESAKPSSSHGSIKLQGRPKKMTVLSFCNLISFTFKNSLNHLFYI